MIEGELKGMTGILELSMIDIMVTDLIRMEAEKNMK